MGRHSTPPGFSSISIVDQTGSRAKNTDYTANPGGDKYLLVFVNVDMGSTTAVAEMRVGSNLDGVAGTDYVVHSAITGNSVCRGTSMLFALVPNGSKYGTRETAAGISSVKSWVEVTLG